MIPRKAGRGGMEHRDAGAPRAGFEEIDHTADRAVHVWAPTLEELFRQAARAMFSLMLPLEEVPVVVRRESTLPMRDLETGLVDWLNELLFWRETHGEMYRDFGVSFEDGENSRLRGWFEGGPASPRLAVVKAATFHNLQIRREDDGLWHATIVFDT